MPASKPGLLAIVVRSRVGHALAPVFAGLAFAVLMTAAFPPFGLWPCVLAAPVPLVLVAIRPSTAGRRSWKAVLRSVLTLMALVSLGALPFNLYEQEWVIEVSALGYFPLSCAMALFAGLFVILLRLCRLRLPWLPVSVAAPVIWTGLEVLRGEVVFTGYPWYLLAHPLIDFGLCAAMGSVVGAYGVSFAAAIPAGVVGDLSRAPRRWSGPIGAGVCAAALCTIGIFSAPSANGPEHLRIGVVQTNLPQDNKLGWPWEERLADFRRFLGLTRDAAAAKPDVIAWPETMFPGAFLDPDAIAAVHEAEKKYGREFPGLTGFYDEIIEFQKSLGIPMLIGAVGADRVRLVQTGETDFPYRPEMAASYNSVFLLTDGKVQPGRYDKIVLTPFGEVMPYIELWPWLQKQLLALGANGMKFDLASGRDPHGFQIRVSDRMPPVKIITPICFEATKPALCRWLVNAQGNGPKVMVNLTNDGWFGAFDPGRWQHLQIARWRAAELGVPVVRVANTGVSAWIDAHGGVVKAGPQGEPRPARTAGVLMADVVAGSGGTIYARVGDVLGWLSLGGTGALVLVALVRRRPISRSEPSSPPVSEVSR